MKLRTPIIALVAIIAMQFAVVCGDIGVAESPAPEGNMLQKTKDIITRFLNEGHYVTRP